MCGTGATITGAPAPCVSSSTMWRPACGRPAPIRAVRVTRLDGETRAAGRLRSRYVDPIIIDGMGSAALLPNAQVPPPALDGKPWLDRALASGLTAMNVTIGITGVAMGADDFRSVLHTMHGYFCYFDL